MSDANIPASVFSQLFGECLLFVVLPLTVYSII